MMFGLSDQQVDSYIATLKNHGVTRAVVFGSRAKGNFRPNSDVDIAVFDDVGKVTKLRDALDELPYPHKVDVVAYHKIENPALRDHIDRVGVDLFPA
ncbi:MAG: nucleotidyltransferase domain-containing protein [Promicromonosporaceae bacterium]|nr:nucleotidyltransferase domain-containing protein [Promicromonosporaceae bacterium]